MVEEIKKVAKVWKRGICTTAEACRGIKGIYEDFGYSIKLEDTKEILEQFATLI